MILVVPRFSFALALPDTGDSERPINSWVARVSENRLLYGNSLLFLFSLFLLPSTHYSFPAPRCNEARL